MSAEVENNKEEEVKEQKPKKTLKDLFKDYCLLGIKLLELLICAICMGLSYDPLNQQNVAHSHLHHIGVMYTAFTGYMVINSVMIVGKLIGDKIPFRTASIFAIIGAALFLVAGILLAFVRASGAKYMQHPHAYLIPMLTTSIVLSFLNAIVFLVDAVLTFIRKDYF